MATETTETKKKTDETAAADTAEETREQTVSEDRDSGSETGTDEAHAADVVEDYADDTAAPAAVGSGPGAGAAAIVSAGLGLTALTGSSVGEMMRDRKQLIGQIQSSAQAQQGGGAADQITALYGAPWHATALINGIFSLLAVLVGGVLLALVAKRAETRGWIKSVALGGVILGAIGVLVSAGMYLDLFAAPPEVPGQ